MSSLIKTTQDDDARRLPIRNEPRGFGVRESDLNLFSSSLV